MRHRELVRRSAGFGLVEIMVALAIGMIATLVIVQVATSFERQKRSTIGSADAQTTGSVALYLIQRQVQMGGYGLPVFSKQNQVLNCAAEPSVDHDGVAGTPLIGIAPVTVINGANGTSDTIAVRMGNTSFGGVPLKITSVSGTNVTVVNNLACQPLHPTLPNIALITDGVNCSMKKITTLPDQTHITLDSITGAAVSSGSSLACMGQWIETRYTVNGDMLFENGVPIADGVVSMQVRYGISAAGNNNQVDPDSYVDASGGTWGATISSANRNRIKAIRVAIVARNGSMEKDNVTQPCSADAPDGPCAWIGTEDDPPPAIDLSADPDWKKYRYRVFDTVIPMRNMIWSADSL